MAQMNLSTEKTHGLGKQMWLLRGRGREGGWTGSLGLINAYH